ncbi:MAG: transcriptional repressor [Prevotella sp.]|nr:transcriptional repressor [Prevotella sp.]MBR1449949.1 transcriptional repressor [Prevotella sp.]
MNQQECTALLVHHGIKPTANRIVVAKALAQAGRPLTLTELEYQILSIDKSGVFRALTLFREHHLVHVIDDGGGGVRYELCHSHSDHEDDDLHVHFYCEQCHRTYCLEQTPVPLVDIPGGFRMISVNYIVKGICAHCRKDSI